MPPVLHVHRQISRGQLLLGAVLCVGCIDYRVNSNDTDEPQGPVQVVDSFVQRAQPKVDLLFVIDDTGSMAGEQAALALGFGALAEVLEASDIQWHAGVVTMNLDGDRAGWLLGQPYVFASSQPQAASAFASAAQVGTDGVAPEAGIAAALLALDLSVTGHVNEGFRRADAALQVIFVSDADDASADYRPQAQADLFDMLEAQSTDAAPARASAIVGGADNPCGAADASAYHAVVLATGGSLGSVCSGDFGPVMGQIAENSITYPTRFELRAEPDEASLDVSIDGTRVPAADYAIAHEAQASFVVFDQAPAPSSAIEVSYILAETAQ